MDAQNSGLASLEDKYMKLLENSYKDQQELKTVKKLKIKSSIRRIQRSWRNYYKKVKLSKILIIQTFWKNYSNIRKKRSEMRRLLKNKYYARIIVNRLTNLVIIKRSKKVTDELKSTMDGTDYTTFEPQIIKIQNFARLIKAKTRFRFLKLTKKSDDRVYFKKWNQHCPMFSSTKSVDCELMRRLGYLRIELAAMEKYLSMQYDDFDKNWVEYEKKLHTYLTQEKEFEDWHETTDELNNTFWINHKTLKKSQNHPGIKSFKVNKQKLKSDADEEQQLQIGIVEHVRKRFNNMIPALMEHRGNEAKQHRTGIIKQTQAKVHPKL
jgi:hypothetical protein